MPVGTACTVCVTTNESWRLVSAILSRTVTALDVTVASAPAISTGSSKGAHDLQRGQAAWYRARGLAAHVLALRDEPLLGRREALPHARVLVARDLADDALQEHHGVAPRRAALRHACDAHGRECRARGDRGQHGEEHRALRGGVTHRDLRRPSSTGRSSCLSLSLPDRLTGNPAERRVGSPGNSPEVRRRCRRLFRTKKKPPN